MTLDPKLCGSGEICIHASTGKNLYAPCRVTEYNTNHIRVTVLSTCSGREAHTQYRELDVGSHVSKGLNV